MREAGRRYRRTEAGRASHAACQQRYLMRRDAKMMHQSENRTRGVAENLSCAVELISPAPVVARDAPIASGEETAHAPTVDSGRFETRRDSCAGDGGPAGDAAQGSIVGGAPPSSGC